MQKFIIIAFVSMALTACLDSTPNFSSSASSASTSDSTEMAECNSISISSFNLTGEISTYYDAASAEIAATYMIIELSTIPAALLTSSTVQIDFIPWYEQYGGVKTYSAAPVYFYFMDNVSGAVTPSAPINSLNLAAIQQAMTQFDYAANGLTISDFFAHEMIVLVGVNAAFEAVTIAYYDTSVSETAQNTGDVLLPAFLADPNAFEAAYPVPDLYSLHPYASYISTNTTGTDFGLLDDQICEQMTGGAGRIPASLDKAALIEKLKNVRYLAVGKKTAAHFRGAPHVDWFGKIWHEIVESLSFY
jgi:hypothetical protein